MNEMYALMPLLSSASDCGENTGAIVVIVQTVDDIDPDEPSNIKCLLAFE